jgi:hypothetical protein
LPRCERHGLSFLVADISSDQMLPQFARQLFALDESAVSIDVFEGDALVDQFARAWLCVRDASTERGIEP